MILALVAEAVIAGAREPSACAVVGISARTLKRWKQNLEDRRRGPLRGPSNRLTDEERAKVLSVCNSAQYRDLSPNQIVPLLADEGIYLASERTMYRILHANQQARRRGRARAASPAKPAERVATAPNQVWSWDITFLKSRVRGAFYYLYLVVDIFSRKVVGWSVHEDERADLACELVERACERERVARGSLVLHSDNGAPMKAATMLATMQRLGVASSFSRPNVSDDNPYSEALFHTLKYHRAFPSKPFASLEEARAWVENFVAWYNHEHLHSGIRFVTPAARHAGADARLLEARDAVYRAAREACPSRWTRGTRNWSLIRAVRLNPARAA